MTLQHDSDTHDSAFREGVFVEITGVKSNPILNGMRGYLVKGREEVSSGAREGESPTSSYVSVLIGYKVISVKTGNLKVVDSVTPPATVGRLEAPSFRRKQTAQYFRNKLLSSPTSATSLPPSERRAVIDSFHSPGSGRSVFSQTTEDVTPQRVAAFQANDCMCNKGTSTEDLEGVVSREDSCANAKESKLTEDTSRKVEGEEKQQDLSIIEESENIKDAEADNGGLLSGRKNALFSSNGEGLFSGNSTFARLLARTNRIGAVASSQPASLPHLSSPNPDLASIFSGRLPNLEPKKPQQPVKKPTVGSTAKDSSIVEKIKQKEQENEEAKKKKEGLLALMNVDIDDILKEADSKRMQGEVTDPQWVSLIAIADMLKGNEKSMQLPTAESSVQSEPPQ